MPVNSEHEEYKAALVMWQRCRDTFAGTDAVKARSRSYLPPLDSHKVDHASYLHYVMRAMFFNASRRTVKGLAGAVFQRSPQIVTQISADQQLNITRTGKSIEAFSLNVLIELLITGRVGLLVDMPTGVKDGDTILQAPNAKPYWIDYKAESIINWYYSFVDGAPRLLRIVLKENYFEKDDKDEWLIVKKEQCRVLKIDESGHYVQEIWRKAREEDNSKWDLKSAEKPLRGGEPLTFIPFVFLGPNSIQPDVDESPILDLVDINLSHFRTSADLEHGLHFTALPTPYATGTTSDEKLVIGSGEAWLLSDPNSKVGMLEFNGQGLGALERADERKRKMMASLGARLLEDSTASESTVAVKMRASGEQATLKTIVQQLDKAISWLIRIHEWWQSVGSIKIDDSKSNVDFNKDFISGKMSPEEIKALVLLLQSDGISYETFYAKLQDGEMTRDGVSVEDERKLIDEQSATRADNVLNNARALAEISQDNESPNG